MSLWGLFPAWEMQGQAGRGLSGGKDLLGPESPAAPAEEAPRASEQGRRLASGCSGSSRRGSAKSGV